MTERAVGNGVSNLIVTVENEKAVSSFDSLFCASVDIDYISFLIVILELDSLGGFDAERENRLVLDQPAETVDLSR